MKEARVHRSAMDKKYDRQRVNIGRSCWPEWERQRCLYGKQQSQVVFIAHLLLTHRHHCREVQCQSADSNTSYASEMVASVAKHRSGAEESPHDDPAVNVTMDDNQTNEVQSAEIKRTNLMSYLWAQTAPDGDTKDNISFLQDLDTTPPLPTKLVTTISSPAGLLDATAKDNVSNLEDFEEVQFSDDTAFNKRPDERSSFELEVNEETDSAESDDYLSTTCKHGGLTFDGVQSSGDHVSAKRLVEESRFELEVDEETDSAESGDYHSVTCSEYDTKQEHEGLTGDNVSANRLDGESRFELEVDKEVDEETDSEDSGNNASCEEKEDGHTEAAQGHQDSDWEPAASEDSLSEEEDGPQPKTAHQPKTKTDSKANLRKRKYVKKQNKEIPLQEEKKTVPRQPRVCSVCNREFKRPIDLKRHFMSHTGERPFLCSTCGRSYRSRGELTMHLEIHQGQTYECPHCKKTLASKPSLRNHLLIHSGKRPFVCSNCGKSFLSAQNLKRHARVHSGEMPFKCDTCGKGFNQAYNLTVHLRTHTGVVPFPCTVCGKGFKHAFSLRNHMKKHDVHD